MFYIKIIRKNQIGKKKSLNGKQNITKGLVQSKCGQPLSRSERKNWTIKKNKPKSKPNRKLVQIPKIKKKKTENQKLILLSISLSLRFSLIDGSITKRQSEQNGLNVLLFCIN